MTTHESQFAFDITIPVRIRRLRRDDLRKLEWGDEFIHYRKVFLRNYQEQLKGNRLLLVADCNDYPIGRLFMQFKSNGGRLADGISKGYIYSFQVMALFRRQGIGSRMLSAAESIFAKHNFETVTIAVAKDNFGALRLYQRHGYAIFGQHDGRWQYRDHNNQIQQVDEPSWLMQKELTLMLD